MRSSQLRGVIAATATPVHPDFSPDTDTLVPHLRKLLEGGCDAINLLGTTGEANSFSLRQRLAVMQSVKDAGLPLDRFMVGTGVCSLDETCLLTQAAADLGFAGALVLPPFFYPGIEADALVSYIGSVVERVVPGQLALYLYHIPQNTGVPWPVEVVAELARRHPVLRGIKDSSGDLSYSRGVVAAAPGLDVFPSSEATLCDAGKDGFAGCISATTNLTAEVSQRAWRHQDSDAGRDAAAQAAAQRSVLARKALVSSVKAALGVLYGDIDGWRRTCPPLSARSAHEARELSEELEQAGLALAS
ncbi:dihydrodipicolinate synthase family protein [Ramlibacter sp. WS9]|uniref:dihydrodipicolinate synthase family protein n=1 Tax=Ramlibacter sp. WS9 TaxID=1882741 RepID=UPI001141D743|nr:dihydrodipicolinate synthase family protein [Ramlibacter sp. WS9]ROZ77609.1 dihydrodipicolinate synthase family protein [Ramlibacter sp. WS9]